MTEPLTDDQLAAMLSERQLTAIRTTASALATIPAYRDLTWRTVETDSERIDGIAPVCASDEHGRLDDGARDEHGTYDCCPWPVVECHSEALASHLVALLTGAPTLLAEVDRLRQEVAGLDDLRIRAIDKGDQTRAEADRLRKRVAELETAEVPVVWNDFPVEDGGPDYGLQIMHSACGQSVTSVDGGDTLPVLARMVRQHAC